MLFSTFLFVAVGSILGLGWYQYQYQHQHRPDYTKQHYPTYTTSRPAVTEPPSVRANPPAPTTTTTTPTPKTTTMAPTTTTAKAAAEQQAAPSTTRELIRSRGFLAESFDFTTQEGYILNIVRANNPMINGGQQGGREDKSLVLMVHGMLAGSLEWAANSQGARPRDYGHLSAAQMDEEELMRMLERDPTSNSLALTLLNFGHEVWLFDRRGTRASQGHKSKRSELSPEVALAEMLDSLDRDELLAEIDQRIVSVDNNTIGGDGEEKEDASQYWDYSFDEQAAQDLPQLVDHILQQSGRQDLSLVGYSAGGTIVAMAAASRSIAKEKLRHVMLWAPAMELGHNKSNPIVKAASSMVESLLVSYVGPVGASLVRRALSYLGIRVCSSGDGTQSVECAKLLIDALGGPTGDQLNITPEFAAAFPDITNSHELAQLVSACRKKNMDHFDYLSRSKNKRRYNQTEPPNYDISQVDLNSLSLWYGNKDTLVTPADNKELLKRFQMPVQSHFISNDGLYFNHFSFVLHQDVARFLNIPALRTLEEAD